MIDADAVERITEETEQIIRVISGLTGLTARWSGMIFLDANLEARGTKPYNCDIILRANLASNDERWRTLIHEVIHCFSAGYNPIDFLAYRGWEEGVVEQLQRLLRPTVLAQLDVSVEEAVFVTIETEHPFNPYIEALESVRQALDQESLPFYVTLLTIPIRQRYAALMQEAMQQEAEKRRAAVALLSQHKETLSGRV